MFKSMRAFSAQTGFILGYAITALCLISLAVALMASMKTSRGNQEIRDAELDRMVQLVPLLDAAIKSCGKCGGSVGAYTDITGASDGFVPAIYLNGSFTTASGLIADMACPNIVNGANIPRFVWDGTNTSTSLASRSILGRQAPKVALFDINYELTFLSGKAASSLFYLRAKSTTENPRELYDRFINRKDSGFIGVNFTANYSNRSIILDISRNACD